MRNIPALFPAADNRNEAPRLLLGLTTMVMPEPLLLSQLVYDLERGGGKLDGPQFGRAGRRRGEFWWDWYQQRSLPSAAQRFLVKV
jgi:hypothetical protein